MLTTVAGKQAMEKLNQHCIPLFPYANTALLAPGRQMSPRERVKWLSGKNTTPEDKMAGRGSLGSTKVWAQG